MISNESFPILTQMSPDIISYLCFPDTPVGISSRDFIWPCHSRAIVVDARENCGIGIG